MNWLTVHDFRKFIDEYIPIWLFLGHVLHISHLYSQVLITNHLWNGAHLIMGYPASAEILHECSWNYFRSLCCCCSKQCPQMLPDCDVLSFGLSPSKGIFHLLSTFSLSSIFQVLPWTDFWFSPTKDTSVFISPPLCYIQFPVSKIFRLCCIISSNLCL